MLSEPPTVERKPDLASTRDEFVYHKVTPECAAELANIRRAFRELRDVIKQRIPDCRLRAIAITHLGDASRAAIAAAVLSDPGSEAEEE